jgi:hypothetical protein
MYITETERPSFYIVRRNVETERQGEKIVRQSKEAYYLLLGWTLAE